MNCTDCGGLCCSIFNAPVTHSDIDRIAKHLGKTSFEIETCHTTGGKLLKHSGFCGFLREGRCTIYDARPDACRTLHCNVEKQAIIQNIYEQYAKVA